MSKLVVLPPPVVPAPANQAIVVDELVTEGYRDIPLHLIRISYTNRTRFNLEALKQLAENIAEVGILQPILLRPVTPTPEAPQILEIVAGERRFRAACMAGLFAAPSRIKILDNKQAAEIQLLENIQRENPHPLEEAIGFEQLMLKHGYNADQLAAKVKQSRSYVYGRLKLCALSIKARELFLDDIKRFPASTALLIARIPTPALQDKALGEIMLPQHNGELMSVRQAANVITHRYTLDLKAAPFDTKDAKLMAAAGNCVKCPKRTGNQHEVFADLKNADVCTDPDCFAEKKAAHYQRIIVIANKKGLPILEGEAARAEISHSWSRDCDLVTAAQHLSTFDRVTPSTGMAGTVSKYLSPEKLPAPIKYRKNNDGSIDEVFRRADIQAALEEFGACETESARAARIAEEAIDPKVSAAAQKKQNEELEAQKQREANKERATAIRAERTALYRKLRSRAAAGFSLHMLRELAKLLIRDHCNEYSLPDDLIGDLYNFDRSDDSACAYIDQADAGEVQMLILDTVLGEALSVHPHYLDEEPSPLEDAFFSMTKLEGLVVTAADISIERIDVALLNNSGDVLEVIEANIEHLAEVAAFIIDRAPHHLGNVEAAANQLGYFFSSDGWKKKEPPAPEAAATHVKPERMTLKLNPAKKEESNAAPIDGPVIKTKKTRTVVAPKDAWPFPTDSKQSM